MKNESGSLKDGLTHKSAIGQKEPRGETDKGARPKGSSESVKSDRGSFKMQ